MISTVWMLSVRLYLLCACLLFENKGPRNLVPQYMFMYMKTVWVNLQTYHTFIVENKLTCRCPRPLLCVHSPSGSLVSHSVNWPAPVRRISFTGSLPHPSPPCSLARLFVEPVGMYTSVLADKYLEYLNWTYGYAPFFCLHFPRANKANHLCWTLVNWARKSA